MRTKEKILIIFALMLTVSCVGKKSTATEESGQTCQQNSDCDRGFVCLSETCVNASGTALLTDPANAITPTKVKSHIEELGEKNQARANEALGEYAP